MNLTVISGGLSSPSSTRLLAGQLGDAVLRSIEVEQETHAPTLTTVELSTLTVAVAQALTSNHRPPALEAALTAIRSADAVIIASPIFNGAPAGPVVSLLDLLSVEDLAGVPVLLAATGGTVRHSQAIESLRPMLAYLGAIVAPTTVFVATEEWGGSGGPQGRIERAGAELAALTSRTARRVVEDPYDNVVSFEQQLAHFGGGRPVAATAGR